MTTHKITPEDCRLVAHDTGDGWSLEVHLPDQNQPDDDTLIAYLDWPKNWPETLNAQAIKAMGFEVA